MFWNSERRQNLGYHLKPVEFENDDAIIKMDSGWNGYSSMFPSDDLLVKMNSSELAEHAGFKNDSFQSTLNFAIRAWRNAPATSLINILKDAEQGTEGQPLFSDIRNQSQVLASGILLKVFRENEMTGVWGGKYQEVKGTNELTNKKERWKLSSDYSAMTALGEQAALVNSVARTFRIWEERNRAMIREGIVKVPKKLYRGIRDRDLDYKVPTPPRELDRYETDVYHYHYRKEKMLNNPLADISHSEILSFTNSKAIAEYFAGQNGSVLEISSEELSIISGWNLDYELSGKDHVNGKDEKEWIVRVGNYKLKPENIINANEDIGFISRNPADIHMVNTNSVKAYYDLNDKPVMCYSSWNSAGTKASLQFTKRDESYSSSMSRSEFKKNYGFDPLPGEKDKVENLQYFSYDRYSSEKDKLIPYIDINKPIDEALSFTSMKL